MQMRNILDAMCRFRLDDEFGDGLGGRISFGHFVHQRRRRRGSEQPQRPPP